MVLIGQGAYGCVFKPAIPCKDGSTFGASTVSKVFDSEESAASERKLHALVAKLDPEHRFTVPLHAACDVSRETARRADPKQVCRLRMVRQIVYEYGGVDLHNHMKGIVARDPPPPAHVVSVLRGLLDIAVGVAVLSEAGFVHSDIKAANILIDDSKRCRLIDFGLLRRSTTLFVPRTQYLLGYTADWCPPEYKLWVHWSRTGWKRAPDQNRFVRDAMQNLSGGRRVRLLDVMLAPDTWDAQLRGLWQRSVEVWESSGPAGIKAWFKEHATRADVYAFLMLMVSMHEAIAFVYPRHACLRRLHDVVTSCLRADPSQRATAKKLLRVYRNFVNDLQ